MNKIIERILSENPNAIFVFDVDGVLASYEYGDYNHGWPEDVWENLVNKGDPYQYVRPFKVMQDFINRYRDRCYVCSKTSCPNETNQKQNFVYRHYGIEHSRQYYVQTTDDKLTILARIFRDNPNTDAKYIVMIEDTVKTLDYIFERSKFATVHVSSFFE